MTTEDLDPAPSHLTHERLSRRRILQQGAGLATLAALREDVRAQSGTPIAERIASPIATHGELSAALLNQFDAGVDEAMRTFHMVGAAVALVDRAGIRYQRGFGVRDLDSNAPVTPDTHFFVASTTKSMSSLLVATLVDEGILAWDQPVREAWPDFRAPTPELTETLRVRDLFGMATGIGEPPSVSSFHQGDPTAAELLSSLATLPVTNPPNTTYFYNNTVYAAGGYLPALVQGASGDQLETSYAQLIHDRVYGPAGMTTARITDDPRPFFSDYATGYSLDLVTGTAALPFAPVGAYAPVGGTLASLTDMAAYVTMQLNAGVGPAGERVVSAANLTACWEPHIDVPTSPELTPDLVSSGYAMGWISQMSRDGRRLVWHNGGIDGFSTFIGFFPEDDLGLVVLTNMGPLPRGLYFTGYVLNLLLNVRFGLDMGTNAAFISQFQAAEHQMTDLTGHVTPVVAGEIASYLGHYEKGWRVELDDGSTLRLHQSSRVIPLLALASGDYAMANGEIPGNLVRFSQDSSGLRWMEIQDIETARWLSGPV